MLILSSSFTVNCRAASPNYGRLLLVEYPVSERKIVLALGTSVPSSWRPEDHKILSVIFGSLVQEGVFDPIMERSAVVKSDEVTFHVR